MHENRYLFLFLIEINNMDFDLGGGFRGFRLLAGPLFTNTQDLYLAPVRCFVTLS